MKYSILRTVTHEHQHWYRNQTLQTTFTKACSVIQSAVCCNIFSIARIAINQIWFIHWLGVEQATVYVWTNDVIDKWRICMLLGPGYCRLTHWCIVWAPSHQLTYCIHYPVTQKLVYKNDSFFANMWQLFSNNWIRKQMQFTLINYNIWNVWCHMTIIVDLCLVVCQIREARCLFCHTTKWSADIDCWRNALKRDWDCRYA